MIVNLKRCLSILLAVMLLIGIIPTAYAVESGVDSIQSGEAVSEGTEPTDSIDPTEPTEPTEPPDIPDTQDDYAVMSVGSTQKSILLFESFFAISFALILFGQNNFCLVLAFLMTGLARGAASNYCNAKINALAPGKAWIINGLHAMFSIGAFLFPILLTLITGTNASNWTYACVMMLAVGVLAWFLYWMIPEDEEQKKQRKTEAGDF